jgi:predicted amidohydrolase
MSRLIAVLSIWLVACWFDVARAANDASHLRVASLGILPAKWDKEANAQKVERMVREAARQGARLIVTPEGVLDGYVENEVIREKDPMRKSELIRRFNALAEPTGGEYILRFRKLADALDIYLVVGFLERDGEHLYNAAVLIGPDGHIVGKYRKTHFHQGYDVNPQGYLPGDEYPVFDLGVARVGIMICFDRQLPEPARLLTLAGANVILCPSYGSSGDWNTRLMQVRAYENEVYVVFTHPTHHFIIDPDGKILGEDRTDTILIRDFDLSRPTRSRQSLRYRRPETYQNLTKK